MPDRSLSPRERRRSRTDRDDRDRFRESDRERRHSRDRDRDRRHSESRHGHSEPSSQRKRDRSRDQERRREIDRSRDRDHHQDRHRSSRDRSRDRHRGRDRDRDKDRRSPDLLDLRALGVGKLSEDDYYSKSGPFRSWLSAERGLVFSELNSEEGRKYFRRFVRRWNDGALAWRYYDGSRSSEASSSRPSALPSVLPRLPSTEAEPSDEEIGPSLPCDVGPVKPSFSELLYAKEATLERAQLDRKLEAKSQRRAVYDRAEELVPKMVGREGKMAEKKAANAANKEMREKDTDAVVDEGTLFGDGGGFAAAVRAREMAAARRAEKKADEMAERRAAMEDRMSERRQKEAATMDMFKELARQRFGG